MLYIMCAAIEIKNTRFTGKNHGECLGKLKQSATQGFMADDYNGSFFVNRKKALVIAKRMGQIVEKHTPKNELLSEDMQWSEKKQRFLTGEEIGKGK